jgi:hypothetical protein
MICLVGKSLVGGIYDDAARENLQNRTQKDRDSNDPRYVSDGLIRFFLPVLLTETTEPKRKQKESGRMIPLICFTSKFNGPPLSFSRGIKKHIYIKWG